jgi:hypothetical protein
MTNANIFNTRIDGCKVGTRRRRRRRLLFGGVLVPRGNDLGRRVHLLLLRSRSGLDAVMGTLGRTAVVLAMRRLAGLFTRSSGCMEPGEGPTLAATCV